MCGRDSVGLEGMQRLVGDSATGVFESGGTTIPNWSEIARDRRLQALGYDSRPSRNARLDAPSITLDAHAILIAERRPNFNRSCLAG